jgi:hypothetical protein
MVNVYQDGKWHNICGSKLFHNGEWHTLSEGDSIFSGGKWYDLSEKSRYLTLKINKIVDPSSIQGSMKPDTGYVGLYDVPNTVYFRVDGGSWQQCDVKTSTGYIESAEVHRYGGSAEVHTGSIVEIWNTKATAFASYLMPTSASSHISCGLVESYEAYGNIQSLCNFSEDHAVSNFSYLFTDQTALTDVSKLLMPVSPVQCSSMFRRTSITKAPVLGFTDVKGDHEYMFWNCSKLKYIEVNFTQWSDLGDEYTNFLNWTIGVPSDGTFVKPAALPAIFEASNIPPGWSVINKD